MRRHGKAFAYLCRPNGGFKEPLPRTLPGLAHEVQSTNDGQLSIRMTTDTPALRDEELLLRLFIGPNADTFIDVYRALVEGRSKTSLNWAAVFVPTIWFFYRKMWLWGAGITVVPAIFFTFFPDMSRFAAIGLAVACGITANSLYVDMARKHVAAIKRRAQPEEARNAQIAKAGGISVAGLLLGLLLTTALFTVAAFSGAATR